MLKTASGPNGVFIAGSKYQIDASIAKDWISAGTCKLAPGEVLVTKATPPKKERTVVKFKKEKAVTE